MALPVYTLTCLRNAVIAPGVYEFTFTRPEGFVFKAGQFILFDVALIENHSDVQTRALSIASAPSENELLFVAKMKEGGRASRWIEEVLKPGVTVSAKGPFGLFVLHPETPNDYLFIATGTGVAPFRGHIKSALEAGDTRRMDLVFGVRTEEDLFWQEELRLLAQQYDNFFLHLALSQPSENWKGHRGRVQTLAPLIAPDVATRRVYICGNPDMTTELKKTALEEWMVPKTELHVEGYI